MNSLHLLAKACTTPGNNKDKYQGDQEKTALFVYISASIFFFSFMVARCV